MAEVKDDDLKQVTLKDIKALQMDIEQLGYKAQQDAERQGNSMRQDVKSLEASTRLNIERLENRIDSLEHRTAMQLGALMAAGIAVVVVAVAVS
jgi:hypothetical protein